MDKPGKLIMKLRRMAKREGIPAWERKALQDRARDIAHNAAKAEYLEKLAALHGDMAGAF